MVNDASINLTFTSLLYHNRTLNFVGSISNRSTLGLGYKSKLQIQLTLCLFDRTCYNHRLSSDLSPKNLEYTDLRKDLIQKSGLDFH